MDIMMRLKGSGFSVIANEFRERERKLGGGLPLQDFVEIVLQGLPRAKSADEKLADVSALVDLFDEIDINGDGVMEFDEFTSFCVDAGMVATRVKAASLKHRYVRSARHVIKTANGCMGIEKVKWSPEFRRLLAIENTAKSVKLFDIAGKFVAEVGGVSTLHVLPVTPRANENQSSQSQSQQQQQQLSPEKTSRTSERSRLKPSNPGGSDAAGNGGNGSRASATASSSSASNSSAAGIFILDAVFIFKHQWLALSTTDFVISFYDMNETRKSPLTTLLPDSATAAAKCGPSFALIKPLTITTTAAQLLLRFCEKAGLLFSSGNDFVLNVWKIVDSETKVLWKRLAMHQDMVMDLIEVPQHDLIVSCDLHKAIQLWDIHDCRSRGALVGHSHGVKQLVYSSHHDLLLSAGFEFDAYGWDIASRQVVMRLSGHRAPLMGVQIALFQTERAVTADATGVFKVWDISRSSGVNGMPSVSSSAGSRGHGTASQAIQLESIDPSQHFARFEPTTFICMHPHSRDLWTATAGTATLHRFRSTRVQQLDEIPLRAFYHYNANKFIVVAGPVCSIWDGETGTCLEEFSHVGNISGGGSGAGSGKAGDSNGARTRAGSSSVSDSGGSTSGGSNNSAAGGGGLRGNNTVHNGSGSSTSSEPCIEVLACVQDQHCKKLVVVTERGELGVFNALNFVQMRKCQEVFYSQGSHSMEASNNATAALPSASATKSPTCGIVGLHYCSANRLIIATDANESAILVIDDNTNHDSARGMKDTTVLRRLTSIPGGISASAYGFHVCLVATIASDTDEQGETRVSLWDFETLAFVAHCEFQKEHEGHALHLLEFWDEFPVLLGADNLGGVYFYAAMPLINCNTGKLLHSFANDHDYASSSPEAAVSTVRGGSRKKTATASPSAIAEATDADEREESDETSLPQEDKTFITEATEAVARKMLKWRKKSVGSKVSTAAAGSDKFATQTSKPEAATLLPGCAVTCMKVVFDDANARFLLFTGDEAGVVRIWDLTKMIERLSLSKIPEIKCKFLRRGYHPKAMFTRDYVKDSTSEAGSSYSKHQPLLAQGDWRSALLTSDDHDPHFQLKQTDLKRLSRRRLESKKRSTAVVIPSAKQQLAAARAAQQATSATVAFAAAEAFLGAQKKGSRGNVGKTVGFSLLPGPSESSKKRSSLLSLSAASSSAKAQQRRHSAHRQFDDIQIVHVWQAHSDGLTSIEVTKNPDVLVTCALDMRVFVWNWQGLCLGKLFDAENIGRWKWQFKKDDSKRKAEREQLVRTLICDLEMTPLEKAHRRRQTLYQEHTERKSLKDLQRVNTILLDHIISKNPELELLKTEVHKDSPDGAADGNECPTPVDSGSPGGQSKRAHSKKDNSALGHPPDTVPPMTSKAHSQDRHEQEHDPEHVSTLRLHSLAQVGPLLCVNKFEYKNQSLTASGKVKFAELDDLKMDKKYLEQELSISFPTSLSSIGDARSMSSNMDDVQRHIQAAHAAAKVAFESRATLERKTADMYVNLERVKHKDKKKTLLSDGERAEQDRLDVELLEPSEFLKKHIPASKLSVRPQTAPAVHKHFQQTKKLPLPSNQHAQSTTSLPRSVNGGGSESLQSSASTPVFELPRRQSREFVRRESSMDIDFMEEVKRYSKHKPAAMFTASTSKSLSAAKKPSASARIGSINSAGVLGAAGETSGGVASHERDGDEGQSVRKLRAINHILSRAQQYCSPVKEMSMSKNRPSTAPFARSKAKGATANLKSAPSPTELHTKRDDAKEKEYDPDEEGEQEDAFEFPAEVAVQDDLADSEATVRAHLEETKRRMANAMRWDGERSNSGTLLRHDLKKLRASAQQQQKTRRMEDYLQQKRREMNTNIGNVFKRTSFAFQSKAADDPMAILAANNSPSAKGKDRHAPAHLAKATDATAQSLKAKVELEKSATVFGIYGVREVMSVIRLFWSMDEDGSGHISLEELLQYKHFFEKLGYNDMTTVFQAIDKDGNGRVSLKELLETCFHYATKYQVEEMLKLAKVGSVRSYLQGGDANTASSGSGCSSAPGGRDASASLSQEHRRELLDIFRVFDRNGDGGVSVQELMEALRVDDDDVMAKVMAEQASRKQHSASWDGAAPPPTSSGITKEDVERLYGEFDSDKNATLDFDEFVQLMRTLYGPKTNAYFR